ncbi:MAG: hypothetical protein ACXADW_24725 [Candidatus Hodarchaeales archaeon]|jgi:hypothetical protein
MSLRVKFEERFGKYEANALDSAANEHYVKGGTISGENKGSDPFKWVILTVIDFQCVEKEEYRKYHGISLPYEDFMQFCIDYKKELNEHDGDLGWLGLVAGVYDFLRIEEDKNE